MKGEIKALCRLAASAKAALRNSSEFDYTMGKYVSSETFLFLPRKGSVLSFRRNSPEKSAEAWFKRLLSLGIRDVYLLLPVSSADRTVHGFSNTNSGCVLCLWNSGEATFFSPRWSFDNIRRVWSIEYNESAWIDPPKEPPSFPDNSAEFAKTLSDIAELAERIEEKFWADIFRGAKAILDGGSERGETELNVLPGLSEKNLRLYQAADKADVFGCMGSWNDSPPWSAHKKGLSEEYDRLSGELFVQIQRALLFAVNEFR